MDAACDDGVECTVDTCDGVIGCENAADDTSCDDGVECTLTPATQPSVAKTHPMTVCVMTAWSVPYVCLAVDGCSGVPDDALCDDGVECTSDSCNPTAGCENVANNTVCDDGVECTLDTCDGVTGCGNAVDDRPVMTVWSAPWTPVMQSPVVTTHPTTVCVMTAWSVPRTSVWRWAAAAACQMTRCVMTVWSARQTAAIPPRVAKTWPIRFVMMVWRAQDVCDVNIGIHPQQAPNRLASTPMRTVAQFYCRIRGIDVPELSPSTGDGTERTIEGWLKWKPATIVETFFASKCESIVYYPNEESILFRSFLAVREPISDRPIISN